MTEKHANRIDKQAVRRSFSRSAESYDDVAVLQREIGHRMVERLDYIKLQPQTILDAGAGTGHCSNLLLKRYARARIISLDFALPLLNKAGRRGRWLRRPHCLCADFEQLPLADQSIDLVFSNVAIQWCSDLNNAFREFMRVLKPNGLLMFSTFGPDTLKELRAAWAEADDRSHTSDFVDMHDIGDMLVNSQFADPVMDVEHMTLTYDTVNGLVKDLKSLGAHNATQQRNRGMTGRKRWQKMLAAYEKFRTEGRLPATYEVVYGHAWRPEKLKSQVVSDNGEVFVPVNLVGKSR
jgi:malonyl-CoA O-methyltransferase